jgi:hypothetical protein
MAGEPVSPKTTLAIIVGASRFPESKLDHEALGQLFAASARDFKKYLLDRTDGFGLDPKNLLDRFECESEQSQILKDIDQFLDCRRKELQATGGVRDLLFFYVGHGGKLPPNQDYFLAVHATRENAEGSSGIRIVDLANSIKNHAGGLRQFLILDCCFAATAFKAFQQGGGVAEVEVMRAQTQEVLPPARGTSLLCSSSARTTSRAPEGARYTMFSGALLEVLHSGIPNLGSISLAQLGEQIRSRIRHHYGGEGVRPEVLSPDQREDDLKDVPLFPNAWEIQRKRQNFDCNVTIHDDETVSVDYTDEKGEEVHAEGRLNCDAFARLTVKRLSEWINIGIRLDQDKLWAGQALPARRLESDWCEFVSHPFRRRQDSRHLQKPIRAV